MQIIHVSCICVILKHRQTHASSSTSSESFFSKSNIGSTVKWGKSRRRAFLEKEKILCSTEEIIWEQTNGSFLVFFPLMIPESCYLMPECNCIWENEQESTSSNSLPVSASWHESGDLLRESPWRGSAGGCVHAHQFNLPVLSRVPCCHPLLLHQYSSQGCDQSSLLQARHGQEC